MSTNKSQNLKLHLWEPEDDFLRTEFNENFAALDTAVKADRDAIATAQQTANTARTEAAVLPYATGYYTGIGRYQTIDVGFRPSCVIISEVYHSSSSDRAIGMCAALGPQSFGITITDTGFQPSLQFSREYPATNLEGSRYFYIAFR